MQLDTDLVAGLRRALTISDPRAERGRRAAEALRAAGRFRWVGLYDVTPTTIAAFAWTGATPPAHPTFPRTRGLNGAAVETRAPVVANDVANDPRYLTTFEQTGSEMIIPVLDGDGSVLGTIDVESPTAGAFDAAAQGLVVEAARILSPLWTDHRDGRMPPSA
jgi:L-methionine (R)-S-oxide reductase